MKINVSEEKKRVEEQRRILEDNIADFHRRKAQYEAEKANSGHHTLTLGKLGKKKWRLPSGIWSRVETPLRRAAPSSPDILNSTWL